MKISINTKKEASKGMKVFIGIMLLFFSVVTFYGGVVSVQKYNDLNNYYVESDATVSKIEEYEYKDEDTSGKVTFETRYRIYVDYEVDGKLYEDVLFDGSYESSNLDIGDKVTIAYDERNPKEIGYMNPTGNLVAAIVLFVFAALILIIPIIILLSQKKNTDEIAKTSSVINQPKKTSSRVSNFYDSVFNDAKENKNDE